MIKHFPARPSRVAAKLCIVEIMESAVALGNIGRRRARRTQKLITYSKSFFFWQGADNILRNEKA